MFTTEHERSLSNALHVRYGSWANNKIEILVFQECKSFIENDLGDKKALKNLCSSDANIYWQQLSEVLIANLLQKYKFDFSHPEHGPDFVVEHNNLRLHIEVVTPEARGLPDGWINHRSGAAVDFPHQEILLRWTSAIKEKSEKLLGNKDRNKKGYLEKRIVDLRDIYVIAVNSRLLREFGGNFSEINGISQLPFAAEATLCAGPLQVVIDRRTLEHSDPNHQFRSKIERQIGGDVPANTFLDPYFSPISAIWALDLDEMLLLERPCPMVVVHNPNAKNPLPERLLPAQFEYTAIEQSDSYLIRCNQGRLQDGSKV